MTFKRPESVLVVVFTAAGEVLLLRRREPADFWQSVTGSLLPEEAPRAAALRELREETGLAGGAGLTAAGTRNRYPVHPAWRHRYAPGVTENLEHVFSLCLPARPAVRLNPAEHAEYAWLSRSGALLRANSHTDRAAIAALVPEQPAR